jgi:uncharacterized protein
MKKRAPAHTPGDFKLRVRRSRTGRGLFAEERIPKGACIVEYTGRPISKKEENTRLGKYFFDTGRGVIDGNIGSNIARFINHSCAPNCEADGPRGKVFIFALRAIRPGEELTYDYGEEYMDEHFGATGCRCPQCSSIRSRSGRGRDKNR